MKAIHNKEQQDLNLRTTVFNTSKIQNESNSQHNLTIVVKDITGRVVKINDYAAKNKIINLRFI